MKKIVIMACALISFAAALVAPLALTGRLNKETLQRVVEGPQEAHKAEPKVDHTDALTQALKQREDAVAKREEEVRAREEQVKKAQAELDSMRNALATMQMQIEEKLAQADDDHKKRLLDVANSLSKMKADNAAASLESWTPEEAAEVLRLVKDRDRGRILDAMKDKASPLLRALQDKRL